MRSGTHKELINDMEKLIDAYIELAFLDVTEKKKEGKPVPLLPSLRSWRLLLSSELKFTQIGKRQT